MQPFLIQDNTRGNASVPGKWGIPKLQKCTDSEVWLVQVNGVVLEPGVYCCYSDKLFWLAVTASGDLYKLFYSTQTQSVEKAAKFIPASAEKEKFEKVPDELKALVGFPSAVDINVFTRVQNEAQAYLEESQIDLAELLSITEIDELAIRKADEPQRLNLTEQDFIKEKSIAFQKESEELYSRQVSQALLRIRTECNNNFVELKFGLITFLDAHWQQIKRSPLRYTALLNSPVTELLVTIAERLEVIDGRPAISYLMPDVFTQHISDDSLDLDKLSLSTLLKTHILDTTGHYLYHVGILLEHAGLTGELQSIWKSPTGLMFNPYCATKHAHDKSHKFVSSDDLEHIYQHSTITQKLRDAYKRHEAIRSKVPTLLGQLNVLIPVLIRSDAHVGLGQEADAHPAAYPAIISFIEYYRRLHTMEINIQAQGKPTFRHNTSDKTKLAYVLVTSGEDAGLYCLSRYTDNGELRALDEAQNDVKQLCDANTPARYPLEVMVVNQLPDTSSLKQTQPSLIRVTGDLEGTYHVYGRGTDGLWDLTTIITDARIRLPEYKSGELILDHPVSLPIGNVPAAIYAAIGSAHNDEQRMLDVLVAELPALPRTEQQLALIHAQTGHLDLDEFKDVPEEVRAPINDLWHFIQNPGVNLSATDNTLTCIGTLHYNLETAVRQHAEALKQITWSEDDIESEFETSKNDLSLARKTLSLALSDETYAGGTDVLPPSYTLLKALGKPLYIRGPLDFNWFCHFDPDSINAFLADPDYPDPVQYLHNQYSDTSELSELLLEIPPSAYEPIFSHLNFNITGAEFITLLNYIEGPGDRDWVLFDILLRNSAKFIKTSLDLAFMLDKLVDPSRRELLLNSMIKSRELNRLMQTLVDYDRVLELLNESELTRVLEALGKEVYGIVVSNRYEAEIRKDSIKNRLLDVIKSMPLAEIRSAWQLATCLNDLDEEKLDTKLSEVRERLPILFKYESEFSCLSEKLRPIIENNLLAMPNNEIQTITHLLLVLRGKDNDKRSQVLNDILERISIIIEDERTLEYLLAKLSAEEQQQIMTAMQNIPPRLIQNIWQFRLVTDLLDDEQFAAWLPGVKEKFATIVNSRPKLLKVLSEIGEFREQQILSSCDINPSAYLDIPCLKKLLKASSIERCKQLLAQIQSKFTTLISDDEKYESLSSQLTEDKQSLVDDAWVKDLEIDQCNKSTSPWQFGLVVDRLSEDEYAEKRDKVIEIALENSKVSSRLCRVLKGLSIERMDDLLSYFKKNNPVIYDKNNRPDINENIRFKSHIFREPSVFLVELNEVKCKKFIAVFHYEIRSALYGGVGRLLEFLDIKRAQLVLEALDIQYASAQCMLRDMTVLGSDDRAISIDIQRLILQTYKSQIPRLFTCGYYLEDCTKIGDISKDILLIIEALSPEQIKSSYQLLKVLERASSDKFTKTINAISGRWDDIFIFNFERRGAYATNLIDLLEPLTNEQRHQLLCSTPQNMVANKIRSLSALECFVECLDIKSLRIILNAVQSNFDAWFQCYEDLSMLTKFDNEKRLVLLQAIVDYLPNIIKSKQDLESVVLKYSAQDDASQSFIMKAIEGKVPGFVLVGYKTVYFGDALDKYTSLSIKASKVGIFKQQQFNKINIGSLPSKLTKYIDLCQSEGSYHFVFLWIKSLLHFIFGEAWVTAKDTKLAAATYAHHALNNNEACLVRLGQIHMLPEETNTLISQYSNSYLLVGESGKKKSLYYVDYAGNLTKLSVHDVSQAQKYFDINSNTRYTYQDINQALSQYTKSRLPTKAQLDALKDGRLGVLLKGYQVQDILDGTKRPIEHADSEIGFCARAC